MKRAIALLLVLLMAAPLPAAGTVEHLTEKIIEPLPQAKGIIGIEDASVEKIIQAILGSNLESSQKSDLILHTLGQSKGGFWKSFFDWFLRAVSLGAAAYTAIRVK